MEEEDGVVRDVVVDGLTPGTTYTVGVAAVNEAAANRGVGELAIVIVLTNSSKFIDSS